MVYVGGDVPVANYETTGTDDLAEEVAGMGRRPQRGAHGEPRPVRRRPSRRTHSIAQLVERTAEIVWGAQRLGEIVPLPDDINEQFAGYYRMGRTPRS